MTPLAHRTDAHPAPALRRGVPPLGALAPATAAGAGRPAALARVRPLERATPPARPVQPHLPGLAGGPDDGLETPARAEEARAIGWAHARLGVAPPADLMGPGHPLRRGWDAGRRHHGIVAQPAPAAQRRWLALRLHAWRRGRAFDAGQVNARHLADLQVAWCPVLRQRLVEEPGQPCSATVDRLNDAVGYVPGHLVVMSRLANRAKGCLRWDEARDNAALARAREVAGPAEADTAALAGTEAHAPGRHNGLSAAAWERLAALMALVTPLPHNVAATLPLRVLPPPRLRLLNPIQALQALLTRQLLRPGYAARISAFVAVLPGAALRRDFQLFFHTLLSRQLQAGRACDAQARREALEDAWAHPDVLRRWQRFATGLSAEQARALLDQAVVQGLGGPVLQHGEPETPADAWWDHPMAGSGWARRA